MATSDDVQLNSQSPSTKLVYKILEYEGTMTQKEIIEESMLSSRTTRYALNKLKESDIVEERVYLADARQSLYELTGKAMPSTTCSTVKKACDDD